MGDNRRMKVGSGVFTCLDCGRQTRDTGKGEGNLQMCARCIEAMEWANGILDGDYTIEDVPADLRPTVERYL